MPSDLFQIYATPSHKSARSTTLLSVDNPLSVDEIIYRLHGRDTANVAFILLQLELRGLVRADDLHCYVRVIKGDIL